jgi:hypothetical protein
LAELAAISAATMDRHVKPVRVRMRIKGISTTKPSPLLRNSIAICTCADEAPKAPGVIEATTVAHCGPIMIGEFARTLTMTDLVIGWTANHSIRNNASKWIVEGVEELAGRFPFPIVVFDSPGVGTAQPAVGAGVAAAELFTPTKKAVGYTTSAEGRKKRIYDKPATPWQRLQASDVLDAQQLSVVAARVDGINPADLTRQINAIQMQLLDLAKAKTEALAAARHVDLAALQPSINRLAKTK